nr:hypothetical protein [Tanacetum cinerariifolium]
MSSGIISNMLNPSPDTCIDSIFNLNTESTSLVDVSVTTTAEPPLLSATTLPPPSTPLITNLQQTPVTSPANVPSSSPQDLLNFGSFIGFDHRLKALEDNFSEFMQTYQFAKAISSILGIVDTDEAQAENEDFLNKLDENIKKIIKEQVKEPVKAQVSKILPKIKKTVNEQLKNEVLTRSFSEFKTYHAIAANLSELELKKILIDKMERNKSIHRSAEQKNLHKALLKLMNLTNSYLIHMARKKPKSTSAPKEKTSISTDKSTEGSKSHHKSASESVQAEEPMYTAKDLDTHQEFDTVQPWISNFTQKDNSHESFNELMDTLLDFSAFVMNQLKVDTLTLELLTGPTFELMKGSCKILVELEYFLKEVYKATTDQLDWINHEGQQYPHDLRKPLPLIPNSRGHRVIPFDHFINNDLEYLSGGVSSRKESARNVYSKRRIIAITELQIVYWHNYKHLDWIIVRRDDDKLYKFKEGDFHRLHIQDIKDMLLLLCLRQVN